MALAGFLSSFVVFFAVTFVISAESSLNQNVNVFYTRFVRRRPEKHDRSKYFDEVVEVFHTRRRPPPYAFLNDENLTRFVRCDYDPSLPDCDESAVRTTSVKPESASTFRTTTTTRATSTPRTTTTTIASAITTTARATVKPTTTSTTSTTSAPTTTSTTPPTTTTTTTATPAIAAIPDAPSTTEELPLLPDIDDDDNNDTDDNDYDEDGDSRTPNNEGDPTNVNYLDYDPKLIEGAGEDNDYLTKSNEVDEIANTDQDNEENNDVVESAALTQELTTTVKPKSLLSWF